MSKPLAVSELGELLHQARATAARLQEQNLTLEKEHTQRKAAIAKQSDLELDRLRQEHKTRQEEFLGAHSSQATYLENRGSERKNRIAQAHAASRKRALEKIDEKEGRRKFTVQRGILETEKGRDQQVKDLESEFQDFSGQWQEEQRQLGLQREVVRKSFGGYWMFRRFLKPSDATDGDFDGRDAPHLLEQEKKFRAEAAAAQKRFNGRILPVLFRFVPIWLWWLVGIGLIIAGPARLGLTTVPQTQFWQGVGVVLGVITLLYFIGWPLSASVAGTIARFLRQAERMLELSYQAAETRRTQEIEKTRSSAAERVAAFQREWESAIEEAGAERATLEPKMQDRLDHALKRNERLQSAGLSATQSRQKVTVQSLEREYETATKRSREEAEEKLRKLEADRALQKDSLRAEWAAVASALRARIASARAFSDAHFPPWTADARYQPPEASLDAVKFGESQVEIASPFSDGSDTLNLAAPLTLLLPLEASVFIETDENGRAGAIECLNNIVYRVLQTVPPGKAAFTFVDPVHLGQSFSSIMHLADYEENIVHRRIWTEPGEIEERLVELNAHMEKVIQMYLRNEFRDIAEYNKEAGRIAEKYHFLVIGDFPANFTEAAMRRLLKIAASGARCGVFLLIHCDKRLHLPPGFELNDLLQSSIYVQATRHGFVFPRLGRSSITPTFDRPPTDEVATRFLQEVGEASRGSNTVQVPFAQIAPGPEARWTLNTTEELRVPIGRSGANKFQYFSLGKGTRQHVLIAGKTGSGKSTLFHVLITNLSLWSSPDQVEFYLVDFKKGVEFKDYATAKLPHARVIAIESDREFGLSVLRRVDEELRVRGELFRAVGAQDLAGYKRAAPNGKMPRVLLIIDEFQELFVEDDAIAQNAALLLDRIVRQGRAFGIHVVLGSQTLGGAYSLARSTLGQMVVRIALQCNEADAYLIMDENNPAPRLLSRPGEGIYNDSGGMLEANSPFQVVWLPETERRAALHEVRVLAERKGEASEPIVFEGNSLADIDSNAELALAASNKNGDRHGNIVWLGLPNEIKGPTRVVLDNRSGKNLLIAGQHDDHARALLAAAMISLAAQNGVEAIRFVLLEGSMPGSNLSNLSLPGIAGKLPQATQIVKPSEIPETFRSLAEEVTRRESGAGGPKIFIVIHNLSAFKALRPEDEFSISFDEGKSSPAADFQRVYSEGPVHGIHVIAHVDGFTNANRFLGRKGLKEFSARVLFQMSASDSASFADDPRAGNLGLNRALLYDEQEGTYETFRPYGRPDSGWLGAMEEKLRTAGGATPLPANVSGPSVAG